MKPTILYLIPVTMAKGPLGTRELARRGEVMAGWTADRARVEVTDLQEGAVSIESFSDEALSVTPAAARIRQAAASGVDAIVIGCYSDLVLEAARELYPGPVIGPAQASMHCAAMLGERFSILTVTRSVVPLIRRLVKVYGMESKAASILAVDLPVLGLGKARKESYQRLLAEGRKAVAEHGADALILGCMSMAFQPYVAEELQNDLGVPVVNPVRVAIDLAILLCNQNLSHGGRAHQLQPAGTLACWGANSSI